MNVCEIERVTRSAWPAFEEEELSCGVLRYASGTDRRVNALSLYPDSSPDPRELIEATERFFGERGAAPIVRIVLSPASSLAALHAVDAALACRGYEKQSPTSTMVCTLGDLTVRSQETVVMAESLSGLRLWLRSWYALSDRPDDGIEVHALALSRLDPENLLLATREEDGELLGTGMGVLAAGSIGLFGIATAGARRREGHATTIVCNLLQCAQARGARYAYLQVEESNAAAIRLYEKLGFTRLYSYWYRVGQRTNRN